MQTDALRMLEEFCSVLLSRYCVHNVLKIPAGLHMLD